MPTPHSGARAHKLWVGSPTPYPLGARTNKNKPLNATKPASEASPYSARGWAIRVLPKTIAILTSCSVVSWPFDGSAVQPSVSLGRRCRPGRWAAPPEGVVTPLSHLGFFSARLAQSAERKALNLVVVGSSPTVGVIWVVVVLMGTGGVARAGLSVVGVPCSAATRNLIPRHH